MRISNKTRAQIQTEAMQTYNAQMAVAGPLGIGGYIAVPPEIANLVEAGARVLNRTERENQERRHRADLARADCGVTAPVYRPSDSVPKWRVDARKDDQRSRLARADAALAELGEGLNARGRRFSARSGHGARLSLLAGARSDSSVMDLVNLALERRKRPEYQAAMKNGIRMQGGLV
jgi:hypothetical protein